MKKIALLLPTLEGGGAERISLNLARELIVMGNEVHIVLLANRISYNLDAGLQVHCLSEAGEVTGQRVLDRMILGRRLKRLIGRLSRNRPFDLILSNLLDVDYIVSKLSLFGVYYVIHNTTSREIATLASSRKAARRTSKVLSTYRDKNLICVSKGVQQDLLEVVGVKPASITTIYNPFDIQAIRERSEMAEPAIPGQDYIIHVGRIHRQKRVDVLLAAVKNLSTPCKLVMLAEPSPALKRMIDEQGLTDRVILPGFQTNPYPWIKHARLLVLSSDYEGLPTVLIESLICGTPVVSTDCPSGPREILNGALTQWLVPVNDPLALAKKVDEALAIGIDLDSFDVERFSINHVASQYLALCESA